MLVCSISQRPPRRAITAELAETAAALDGTTTGFVIFATLVDDPGNARDTLDAYVGEIMLEAASAAETVDAGLAYEVAVDESTTASATQDGAFPSVQKARSIAAARAGLGSVVVSDGSGKTQIISNIGAVT